MSFAKDSKLQILEREIEDADCAQAFYLDFCMQVEQ